MTPLHDVLPLLQPRADQASELRRIRLQSIRREIDAGVYETNERLDRAVEAMLRETQTAERLNHAS